MTVEMDEDIEFRQVVTAAAGRADVRDAVAAVYADLQRELDARRPTCIASGRCCRFEEFGHRLFVTTIELAAFLHGFRGTPGGGIPTTWDGTGCPLQVGKLCGVHAIRPFGCRMFFCDATSTEWQNQVYERLHARLKDLHEAMGVPYRYIEWRTALRLVGVSPESHSSSPDL